MLRMRLMVETAVMAVSVARAVKWVKVDVRAQRVKMALLVPEAMAAVAGLVLAAAAVQAARVELEVPLRRVMAGVAQAAPVGPVVTVLSVAAVGPEAMEVSVALADWLVMKVLGATEGQEEKQVRAARAVKVLLEVWVEMAATDISL
ncbi:hypothetical protein NTH60_004708 [Enterobacter ludwigii]|nr:hypothetical protein [Enterobacter ludwigii]